MDKQNLLIKTIIIETGNSKYCLIRIFNCYKWLLASHISTRGELSWKIPKNILFCELSIETFKNIVSENAIKWENKFCNCPNIFKEYAYKRLI
jgi:hypothetical protein